MKKQILALSLGLLSLGSFAQKKELKVVEKALSGNDYSSALTTLSSIESSIESADAKYKTKYYFFKAKALAGKKQYSKANQVLNKLSEVEKATGSKVYAADAQEIKNNLIQGVSDEALDLYNVKKDYKAAAEKFYLTYKLSPRDTSFIFNAAVSSTQAKDYAAALKCYKELRELGYTGIETKYLATNKISGQVEDLGSKAQRDLMVKAGSFVKPTVESTESKSASIVKNIALILKEQGKTEEAIAAMEEARSENPKDLNLILNTAELYAEMKEMGKYGALMNEAVALDPNNPTLYFNLGVVSYNQGRIADAKNYYKKALELKEDYADAYMNLAVATLDADAAIIAEMNNNLSNFKKYDALALQQKAVYREALPYLEKADSYNRSVETVRTLMGIYGALEMNGKESEFRTIYNSLK